MGEIISGYALNLWLSPGLGPVAFEGFPRILTKWESVKMGFLCPFHWGKSKQQQGINVHCAHQGLK